MAEPRFGSDDDLPRTLRRAREERERQLREQAGPEMAPPQALASDLDRRPDLEPAPPLIVSSGGTVTRFEVPFLHLVRFFLKAVLAAIPALILLAALLFGFGKMLQAFFPQLRLFEIVIRPPLQPAAGPSSATPAASEPAGRSTAPAKK